MQPTFFATFLQSTMNSSHLGLLLAAPNIMNLVTVRLATPEDYLTWQTQFTIVLISHGLLVFVNGTFASTPIVLGVNGVQQSNAEYQAWLHLDQNVRSQIFATLSPEVLIDIHDQPTCLGQTYASFHAL